MKRFLIALVCGFALAGLVSACGGDDEKASETTPTITTETETAPTTDTAPTATAEAPSTTPAPATTTPPADPDSGGTTVPKPTKPESQPQDGPDNDIPPEPGTPAERFEQQCQQNPQTCGD